MTTLKVNLSAQLQTTLGQPGVYAYAVYFDPNDPDKKPVWFDLVDNGVVASSGTVDVALPEPLNGGKIYLLVQSREPGAPADSSAPQDLETVITKESDINFGNAKTNDFRFDSFEVSLLGTPNDVGNLTSVNGFGLPMELSVDYSDGTTATRGYNISGTDLFNEFTAAGNAPALYTSGPLTGQNRGAISPSDAVAQVPPDTTFVASDWDKYIESLQVADPGVEIAGFFNGGADANGVYHNSGFYSYALEWDSTEGVFWLSPADNSEIQGYLKIKPEDLANSIYSTLGDVAVYTNKDDAEPYRILHNVDFATGEYSMNTGENNQWGALLANFLTGFTGGFYGTEGQSLNPLVTTPIDLDDNWNWDPTYAFGKNLTAPPDAATHFQDAYSEILFFNSNSYGSGYSDNLMRQYAEGGPLIAVSNPQTAPDPGKNVSEISLTLFDDGETPSGYIQPVIYNYIAPPSGSEYQIVDGAGAPDNQVKLNLANANMVVADDTPISLDILTGWDAGAPVWQTVTFDAPAGVAPWAIWNLSNTGGTWSAELEDPYVFQGRGQLLIKNFPTSDAGVYWYRLNIGEGDDGKTYNLYLETTGTDPSSILNPNFGTQQGSLAIDGQAEIAISDTTSPTINVVPINFLYGATNTVDPDILVRDTTKTGNGTPNAPVAGTWTAEAVSGAPTPTSIPVFHALAGQDNQVSNTISTSEAQIAFGWTGLNDVAAGTNSWISGYTNKTGALNTAQVNVVQNGQTYLSVTTKADIDGQWVTAPQYLGNGTYTVTMSEFLASDTTNMTPVGVKSSELTLTVDTAELDLTSFGIGQGAGGAGLGLVSVLPDDPPGNWVNFQVLHSSLFSAGAVILIYATNEAGELVSRDGLETGAGVTLEEATLGTVGTVRDDNGHLLLSGDQSVYLATNLELHFAVLKGDEVIDLDPNVRIDALSNGMQKVSVGGYVLTAETENDLTDDATLASAQRLHNQEFVYLDHGATVDVDVFGSSGNTNTLGFVRLDLDPDSGEWSVGSVPYGDTDAFREAVEANLDAGFLVSRGGDFSDTLSWTVAGEDGYYAPVLMTQNGDTFIVGYGNDGGNEYVRTFGHNTFGFEDLTEAQGADFDHNDMVVRISPEGTGGDIDGAPGDAGDFGLFVAEFLQSAWNWAEVNLPGLDQWPDLFDFPASPAGPAALAGGSDPLMVEMLGAEGAGSGFETVSDLAAEHFQDFANAIGEVVDHFTPSNYFDHL